MHIRQIGTTELKIPQHMSTLPQYLFDVLCDLADAAERVLSCGVDPDDGCLYMITGDSSIRKIKPNGHLVPVNAWPSTDGTYIGVSFRAVGIPKNISARVALNHSVDCFDGTSLVVNNTYLGDLQLDSAQVSHENQTRGPEKDNS